jgi:ABC-type transporter Mla subunit MlaD
VKIDALFAAVQSVPAVDDFLTKHKDEVRKVYSVLSRAESVLDEAADYVSDIADALNNVVESTAQQTQTKPTSKPSRQQMLDDMAEYCRRKYGFAMGWDSPTHTNRMTDEQIENTWRMRFGS